MAVSKAQFFFFLLSISLTKAQATPPQGSVSTPAEVAEEEPSPYIILKASATSEDDAARDFREEVRETIAAETVKTANPMSMVMPYRFRFNVEDSDEGVYHRRSEVQPKVGPLVGSYSYLRSDGVYMTVRYTAGSEGYRATVYETLPPASYSRSKPVKPLQRKEQDRTPSAAANKDSDTLGLERVEAEGEDINGLRKGAGYADRVDSILETTNSDATDFKQVSAFQDRVHSNKKTPSQILRELMMRPHLKVKNPKVDVYPTRVASVGPFVDEELPMPITHQLFIPSDKGETVPLVERVPGVFSQQGEKEEHHDPNLYIQPQSVLPIIETNLHLIEGQNTEKDSILDELLVYGDNIESSKDQNEETEVKSTIVPATPNKNPAVGIGSEKITAGFYLPLGVSDRKTISSDILRHKVEKVNSVSQNNIDKSAAVRLDSLNGEVIYPVVYLHGETEDEEGVSNLGQSEPQIPFPSIVKNGDQIQSSVKSHDSSTKVIDKSHVVYSEEEHKAHGNISEQRDNSKTDSDATEEEQTLTAISDNHSILTPLVQTDTSFSDIVSGDENDRLGEAQGEIKKEDIKTVTSSKFTEKEDRQSQVVSQSQTAISTDEVDSEQKYVKSETNLSEGGVTHGTQIESEDKFISSDSKAQTEPQTSNEATDILSVNSQEGNSNVDRTKLEQQTIGKQSDSYGKYSELQVISSIKQSNFQEENLKTILTVPYEKANGQHIVDDAAQQLTDQKNFVSQTIQKGIKSTNEANSYNKVSEFPTFSGTPLINTAINSYLPPTKEAAVESNSYRTEEDTRVFTSPDYPGKLPIHSTVEIETDKNSKTSEQFSKIATDGVSVSKDNKELTNLPTAKEIKKTDIIDEEKKHLNYQDQLHVEKNERYDDSSKVRQDITSSQHSKPIADTERVEQVNSSGDEVVKAGNQFGYNPFDVFALKRGTESYSVHRQQVYDQNRYVQKTQHSYYPREPTYNAQLPAYNGETNEEVTKPLKPIYFPGMAQVKPSLGPITQTIGTQTEDDSPVYFVLRENTITALPKTHPIYSLDKKCSCYQKTEDDSQRLAELEESQEFEELKRGSSIQKDSFKFSPMASESSHFQGVRVAAKSSIPFYRMQSRLSSPDMQGNGYIEHKGSFKPSAYKTAQRYKSNFYFRPRTQLQL